MNTKNIRSTMFALVAGLVLLGAMPLAAMAVTATSLSPSFATVGSGPMTLTVNGTDFVPGSTVNFNGNARSTTYVSATQLTAGLLSSDLASVGTFSVTVTNPSGGGTSNAQTFTVGNLVPITSSLSSTSVVAGSAGFTLTVNGSNFVPGANVNFNGAARATTFVSANQLIAAITTADVSTAGSFNVTVSNPAPGGGTSNAQVLTVTSTGGNNPVPALSSISPSSRIVGSGAFTITVNGTNFNTNSSIRYNGLLRPTTFVSSTQLIAAIPASDVAITGSYLVDVINPTPGGGASNFAIFTVAPISGTPQLPDTGFGPEDENAGLLAAGAVAMLGLAAALVARRAWFAKR